MLHCVSYGLRWLLLSLAARAALPAMPQHILTGAVEHRRARLKDFGVPESSAQRLAFGELCLRNDARAACVCAAQTSIDL
eukprot:6683055-Alexandrium_andersonii.AAC.1